MSIIDMDHVAVQQKIFGGFLNAVRQILTNERIRGWSVRCGHSWRERRFCPVISLLACILKQLNDLSARDVEDHLALLARSLRLRDGHSFCNARERLPLPLFHQALKFTGATASGKGERRYKNLKVCLADGTTVRTPRTDENRKVFRTSTNQHGKSRCPLLRMVILVCAGCGAVLDMTYAPYVVGEARLFTLIIRRMLPGMLVIADTTICSYLAFAISSARGGYMLCPLRPDRKRVRVKRLSRSETLESWDKPSASHVAYPHLLKGLPSLLTVRVIEVVVHRKGYRDYKLTLATTLLDPVQYPAHELLELYQQRWDIESDIRTLKLQHGLNTLTTKTPQVVCREMYSAVLAYNVVRTLMAEAGGVTRRLSHHRSREMILNVSLQMVNAQPLQLLELFRTLLVSIRTAVAPKQNRPAEPRAILTRHRSFPYLKISRKAWRSRHRVAS